MNRLHMLLQILGRFRFLNQIHTIGRLFLVLEMYMEISDLNYLRLSFFLTCLKLLSVSSTALSKLFFLFSF